MAATTESVSRSPFTDPFASSNGNRKSIPILPSSSNNSPRPSSSVAASDPMDITPSNNNTSTASMGPPITTTLSSPVTDRATNGGDYEPPTTNGNSAAVVGAAAATQQPKVVQTAFIHKLYKYVLLSTGLVQLEVLVKLSADFANDPNSCSMLEDHSIQHLISWSNTNDSFVMSPSTEFSKVLSYVLSLFSNLRY